MAIPSAYLDDEAIEDSDDAISDTSDEVARLLGTGRYRPHQYSDEDDEEEDSDDGSDLEDFIVPDDQMEGHSNRPKSDRLPSSRVLPPVLFCHRCRCRMQRESTHGNRRKRIRTSLSSDSDWLDEVEVVCSDSSLDNSLMLLTTPPTPIVVSPSTGSLVCPVTGRTDPEGIGESEDKSRPSSSQENMVTPLPTKRKAAFSVCRATAVYLERSRRRSREGAEGSVASLASDSMSSSSHATPTCNEDWKIPRLDEKWKKSRLSEPLPEPLPAVQGLFENVPADELLRAQVSAAPVRIEPCNTVYMAAVGTDLHLANVKETLKGCSLGSSVVMIKDAWGGETEIYPYKEWQKSEDRGDLDDVQAHYIKGPRSSQGKGDLFLLVRESIIDQMVPMSFGGRISHIKVKVFNTKLSMMLARDVASHLASAEKCGKKDPPLCPEMKEKEGGVTPAASYNSKRKRRREPWHSAKWHRLHTQLAATRAPWLRAARSGGAAYQWEPPTQ